MASAERRKTSGLFMGSLAVAALLGACSFQDFSYLQDGSGGSGGSAAGSAPTGGTDGSGGSSAGTGNGKGGTQGSGGDVGSGGSSGSSSSGGSGGGGTTSAGGTNPGSGGSSGSGGSGGSVTGPDMLDNGTFEQGVTHMTMPGWTNTGDMVASFVDYNQARTGFGRLGHWYDQTGYEVSTFQKVGPIPNGTYTFRIWIARASTYVDQYLFARGYDAGDLTAELHQSTAAAVGDVYVEIVLSGIPVTSGECEVGVYSSTQTVNTWSRMDDAEFTLEPEGDGGAPGAAGGPP